MKSLPSSTYLIVSFFIAGFMGIFGHSLLAMDLARNLEIKKYHPKLESVLGRLAQEYSQDRMAMQKFARQRSVSIEDDEVRVVLVPFIWKKEILGRYINKKSLSKGF